MDALSKDSIRVRIKSKDKTKRNKKDNSRNILLTQIPLNILT